MGIPVRLIGVSVLLASSLMLLLALASGPVSAAEPVLIDSYGLWTLSHLGYSDQVFPCQQDEETASITYLLPEDAAQGPEDWYVLHLDFNIRFSEDSGEGFAYVSASTNGYTCAQVKFVTRMVEGALAIGWGTLDIVEGNVIHTTSDPNIDVAFSNYLRTLGVMPGLNTLTFKLEQYADIKVESLRILDSSGIEYTALSPPELEMDVEPPEGSIRAGNTFSIGFEVRNVGGRPAREVEVRPLYSEEGLQLVSQDSYQASSLESSLRGSFEFKALAAGRHEVKIEVATRSGIERPSARVEVTVTPRSSFTRYMPAIAFVALALLASYLLSRLMRRRGGT